MRLSSLADYALVVMAAAADQCGHARLNATQIAARTGLPLPTVQKLVSQLSRAGLLRSMRGTGGGLTLARPPATVSVADIVEAIEGPIAMTACCEDERPCAVSLHCQVGIHHARRISHAVHDALAGISLSSLVAR